MSNWLQKHLLVLFRTWQIKKTTSSKMYHPTSAQYGIPSKRLRKRLVSYGVEPAEIQKLYNWLFSITKSTKLIMFQFKINHNIIYTRDKLKKANIISDDSCQLCKREQHTIQHMFLKCSHVALCWNKCFDWWSQVTSENIHLPDSTLLYGPTNSLKHHQPLSFGFAAGKILYLQM